MTRPSQKIDEKLIQTGLEMLRHSGLSRLNLRQLSAKAGVNLGMFHYHFKTKDKFIRAVLGDAYEKFLKNFSLRIEGERKPLGKLRQALFTLGQFSRDNRHLLLSLLQDVLNQDLAVQEFVKMNFTRHVPIFLDLVRQCRKEKLIRSMPFFRILAFMMPAVLGPSLAVGVFEHSGATKFFDLEGKALSFLILSDETIRERIELALASLLTEKGKNQPATDGQNKKSEAGKGGFS